MDIAVAVQTQTFLFAAVLGMLLGLLFDVLKCIREGTRAGKIITAILDFSFCLVAMLSLFILALTAGQGSMRSYIWAGGVLGAVLYFVGFSETIRGILLPLFKWISRAFDRARRKSMKIILFLLEKINFPRGN